jgi:hypothetical protein
MRLWIGQLFAQFAGQVHGSNVSARHVDLIAHSLIGEVVLTRRKLESETVFDSCRRSDHFENPLLFADFRGWTVL